MEDYRPQKKILYTIFNDNNLPSWFMYPVPLLDPAAMKEIFTSDNSLFGFIDVISGGAFQNATIFAMSITPYINSSIIMQLLTVAIPALERLQKQGEDGKKEDSTDYKIRHSSFGIYSGNRSLFHAEEL